MNDLEILNKVLEPKSDQLNADDLVISSKTGVISSIKMTIEEQGTSIWLDGGKKPWKPCKGMVNVMVQVWGNDWKGWAGKSLTLFREKTVVYAGKEVGGIQISHMSDIPKAVKIPITLRRGTKNILTIKPLEGEHKVEMPTNEFQGIIDSVNDCEDKTELTALNIAKFKDKLSQEQASEMREAYKMKIQFFKQQTEDEVVI